MTSLVLDLRNNLVAFWNKPSVWRKCSTKTRKLILTQRSQRVARCEYRSRNPTPQMPLVILVNDYTASASEIVVGAMQDHDRARSSADRFGKGLVQSIIRSSTARDWRSHPRSTSRLRAVSFNATTRMAPSTLLHPRRFQPCRARISRSNQAVKKALIPVALSMVVAASPDEDVEPRTVSLFQRRLYGRCLVSHGDSTVALAGLMPTKCNVRSTSSRRCSQQVFPITDAVFNAFKKYR